MSAKRMFDAEIKTLWIRYVVLPKPSCTIHPFQCLSLEPTSPGLCKHVSLMLNLHHITSHASQIQATRSRSEIRLSQVPRRCVHAHISRQISLVQTQEASVETMLDLTGDKRPTRSRSMKTPKTPSDMQPSNHKGAHLHNCSQIRRTHALACRRHPSVWPPRPSWQFA